jgi:hypothetical protein
MIIKLTTAEVRNIIQRHFESIFKDGGPRVVDVTSNYNNFEVECGEQEKDDVALPAPRPGVDQ